MISGYRGENHQTILSSLQMALPLLKQSGDSFSVAGCYDNIANSVSMLGQNSTAILFYDSSQQLFQQLGDTTTSAWTMLSIARTYYYLGDYLNAYKSVHMAQENARKNDTMLQALALANLSKLFLGTNLPESAIDCMRKIKDLYYGQKQMPTQGLPWQLVWALKTSGEAFLQLNHVDSAFNIAKLLNIPIEKQQADENIFYGHLYSAMRQPDTALTYFASSYRQSKKSANRNLHRAKRHRTGSHTSGLAKFVRRNLLWRRGIANRKKNKCPAGTKKCCWGIGHNLPAYGRL